ncbi:MAG: hypothetical protein U0T77_03695 [Chitinophagales bacterium]
MKSTTYIISFNEMQLKCKIILEKQPPITFEQAKAQVKWLKENSIVSQQLKKE